MKIPYPIARLLCRLLGHTWKVSPVPPRRVRLCTRCIAIEMTDGKEWRQMT